MTDYPDRPPERPADRPPGRPAARPGGRGGAGLNFWQWLGLIVIAIVVIFYLWRWLNPPAAPPPQEVDPVAPTHAQSTRTDEPGGTSVE